MPKDGEKPNPSLYDINQEIAEMLEEAMEFTEETPVEIVDEWNAKWEELGQSQHDKYVGLYHIIEKCKSFATRAKNEAKRLSALAKSYDNKAARLVERMKSSMMNNNTPKLETDIFRASLRRSKSTIIDDIEIIPEAYKTSKVTVSADKTAIKKAIESGESISGAHIQENTSLTIK